MSPTTLESIDLHPGSWVETAQAALDQLADLATLAEVTDVAINARQIAERTLGYPINGGHATKPVIRAIGRLLQHPLGPALTAEALSWAASVSDIVDTTTILHLLEAAGSECTSFRPPRLADRAGLVDHLTGANTAGQRRRRLLERWDRDRLPGDLRDHDLPRLIMRAPLEDEQLALFALTTSEDRRRLASNLFWHNMSMGYDMPTKYDMPTEIVIACLEEHPSEVLWAYGCPDHLVDHVRYPYDEATLVLALRAGSSHHDADRVARLCGRFGIHGEPPAVDHDELARRRQVIGLAAILRLLDEDNVGSWATAFLPNVAAQHRPHATPAPECRRDDHPGQRRYRYPTPVKRLTTAPFGEAPEWIVSLPRDRRELEANADAMGNCTAGYHWSVEQGRCFIVVIDAPDGSAFNAAVIPDGRRYRVTEINSFANRGIEPGWIRPAFEARMNHPAPSPVEQEPGTRPLCGWRGWPTCRSGGKRHPRKHQRGTR